MEEDFIFGVILMIIGLVIFVSMLLFLNYKKKIIKIKKKRKKYFPELKKNNN